MGEKLEAELNPLVMTACQLAAARIRVHNSKHTQRRQRALIFSINVTLLNKFVRVFFPRKRAQKETKSCPL